MAVVTAAGLAVGGWWVDRDRFGSWAYVRRWSRAARASGLAAKSPATGRPVVPPLVRVLVGPEIVRFEFVPLDGAGFDGPGFAAALGLVSARQVLGPRRFGRQLAAVEVRRLAALVVREVQPMRLADFPLPNLSDAPGVAQVGAPGLRCEVHPPKTLPNGAVVVDTPDRARGRRCQAGYEYLPDECRPHWIARADGDWSTSYVNQGWAGLCDRNTEPEVMAHGYGPPSVERLAALAAKPPQGVRDRDGVQIVAGHAHCIRHFLDWSKRSPGPAEVPGLVQHPEPYGSWREALSAVTVGSQLGGEPWRLRLVENHVLIAGLTGSGKGSVIWSLLLGLAPFVAAGAVEVWGFDPKRTELAMGRDLFSRYGKEPADMLAMLEEAVERMVMRADRLAHQRRRRYEPGPDESTLVLVLDELGDLSSMYTEREDAQRFDRALTRLLNLGRSNGIVLVAGLQDPRKKVLDSRDLWPTKVAMRMPKSMADLVLGSGAYEAGAVTDRIPHDAQGTAFVVDEAGGGEPVEVRAGWVSDQAILETERVVVQLHDLGHARQLAAALVPDRDQAAVDAAAGERGQVTA